MRVTVPVLIATVACSGATPTRGQEPSRIEDLESGTASLLQAVSPAGDDVVWVSGHDGVILRTVDGGDTWRRRVHPTLDSLQFRDVHAFDAETAVVLSSGSGALSRIYRTTDGGETWSLTWMNPEPDGFYDCLDFWDERRGLVYGDAVDGELRILRTEDGGASWRLVAADRLPPALEGEGGFAASGTCVDATPGGRAWIGTGAGERARVLATADFGETWTTTDLPIVSGSAAGAFTLGLTPEGFGVVLGGDLGDPEGRSDNVAVTHDGGVKWSPGARTPFPGAVYGSTLVELDAGVVAVLAVGPAGLAVTADPMGSWTTLDDRDFWAVGAFGRTAWAAGPDGRILELAW